MLKRLTQSRMAEGKELVEYLNGFFGTVDKFEDMGVKINEALLTIILLYSLSRNFENFQCAIESWDKLPDAEYLKVKIIEEYNARQQNGASEDSHALFAKSKAAGQKYADGKHADKKSHKKQNKPRPRYKCGFCYKKGYKEAD